MLTHHSLHLVLPTVTPEGEAYDLEYFVGMHIRPLASRLKLLWFSRYGTPENREIKFRFSVEDYKTVLSGIESIQNLFKHGMDGCGDYDYIADLGGSRFIASDREKVDQADRALLVYQFLTAAARLFIDCLVPVGSGWRQEEEKTSGYNRQTPLETFHHLFCNMTDVPTWAAVLRKHGKDQVVSDLASRQLAKNPSITMVQLIRIQH